MRRGKFHFHGRRHPAFCLPAVVWLASLTLAPVAVATAGLNDIILNEYNSVSGNDYLDSNTSTKTDKTLGRLEGNGQDWLEFLIVEDHLDLRGFALEWAYDDLPSSRGSGSLTFSQDPLWSDLRQGTLLTITEWQEAWYNDENTTNNNFSNIGGVNGLGDDRGNRYDPLKHERFVDFSSDTAWSPQQDDFAITIQAGERNPATDAFRYFDLSGTVTDVANNRVFTVGVDNDADLFVVNNDKWEMTIKDSIAAVVQGPIGEVYSADLGVNSQEIGKFEGAFDNVLAAAIGTVAQYKATTIADYDDGTTSTFGTRNLGGVLPNPYKQGLTGLRTWFNPASIIRRNTTTSGLAFDNNATWLGGATPSSTQEAVFDQGSAAPYNVLFNSSDDIRRLLVQNDRVRLDLSGNTLTVNATQAYDAAVVGQANGDVAELTILGGGTLVGSVIHVAEQPGSTGTLTVSGSGTELSLSQALIVGGRASTPGGTGSVTIDAAAKLIISSADINTLKVFSDATFTTTGGAVTVGSGAVETVAGTLRVYSDGNLDVRGGTLDATTIQLSGGAISGYGTIPTSIVASAASNVFVPQFDDGLSGLLTLSGNISGASADTLTKRGGGTLVLDGNNTYSGTTTILDGILQADHGASLPAASTLRLRGGRLQTSGAFNRSLGSAAGQVNWSDASDSGRGGFAARGGDLTVNLGGAAAAVAWGVGNFVPDGEVLHFNSDDGDAQVEFVNPIDLGTTGTNTREIRVANNGATLNDLALLSGVISNNGGTQSINKTGEGTLHLSAANTYDGTTTIDNGQLRAIDGVGLPTGSNLRLRGGILESQGTFVRSLGTAGGQVNWTDTTDNGDGGFAAHGGSLDVTLNGGASLEWNVGGFVPTGRDLFFGSDTADNVVTMHNAIDIGGFQRIVRVFGSSSSSADRAVLAGVLTGPGGIIKKGDGDLELSAANLYAGLTTVDNGRLTVTGSVTSAVTVGVSAAISGNGSIEGNLVNAGDHDVRAVETLTVNGTATLGATSRLDVTESYSQTRATETGSFQLLTAPTGVSGQFTTPADAGVASHLGNGHFLQSVQYNPTDVTVNILAALEGDADGDRAVDITDFNTLATNFDPGGVSGPHDWTLADFDGDSDVDITDFTSLATNFAPGGYSSLAQSVPEPMGMLSYVMALLFLVGCRHLPIVCSPTRGRWRR